MLDNDLLKSLKDYLDREATRINDTLFINNDPVQFPRRFERLQDIEIVAILSASIAWGNRKMICNNCEKMLRIMENSPYEYVLEGEFEGLADELNIHRTFFARNFKYAMRGFRQIYSNYTSLNDFARACGVGESETPSWRLVECMQQQFSEANNGATDSQCLPTQLKNTALKRINMALRWLVRNDGIVDMGVWNAITPGQLFIPLDVHVGNTARGLGMIERRANDKKTVIELTDILRKMRPDDPVIYDYALFGIGIGEKSLASNEEIHKANTI
ncbi:MAG: TIGR02757 family protein [Muribaculaceae bacterium]|nr:TIGR02757 family protein [Muribaculaceae bacterium]